MTLGGYVKQFLISKEMRSVSLAENLRNIFQRLKNINISERYDKIS